MLLVGDERALRRRAGAPGRGRTPASRSSTPPRSCPPREDGARAVRAKPESSIATACRLVGEGRAGAAVSVGQHRRDARRRDPLHAAHPRRHPPRDRGRAARDRGRQRPAARRGRERRVAGRALPAARPDGAPVHARRRSASTEPRVGLLSIGEEEGKGSARRPRGATRSCARRPGFVGNVEGRDIPSGALDVVVTDGFTGNVVLKTMEGTATFLMGEVRSAVRGDRSSAASAACWCAPRCGGCASASTRRSTAAPSCSASAASP